MSIKDKVSSQNQTVTYGNRALEFFTDRNEITCLFARYLNQDPTPEKILFFHGAGGNGKTLLLEHLRQNCCKRFPDYIWQEICQKMARSQAEAAASIVEHTHQDLVKPPTVAVIHDFGMPPIGNEKPQDPLYGLLMLRRNISREAKKAPRDNRYNFKFPLFDFALFWYFHSIGKSSDEIKNLFPADEVDLVAQIIDTVADIPYVSLANSALKILSDKLGIGDKLRQRGISKEKLAAIQGMDAERELIFHLPKFLAEDLNAEMAMSKSPHRLVLFFDTHEKFWGENRSLPREKYFFQDQWLRNLLLNLDLDRGIMVVVSGRDQPKWAEASKHRIPEEYIELKVIEELTAADGRDYLQKAGISESELATAIIKYAEVGEGLVHPFLLGLCVDVVQIAKAKGKNLTAADFVEAAVTENKPKQLIERLLKYVDTSVAYAVRALTACRAFNFEIYQYLGQSLDFSAMKPDFNQLIEFSFVWQDSEKGEGWYRIHDLSSRTKTNEFILIFLKNA